MSSFVNSLSKDELLSTSVENALLIKQYAMGLDLRDIENNHELTNAVYLSKSVLLDMEDPDSMSNGKCCCVNCNAGVCDKCTPAGNSRCVIRGFPNNCTCDGYSNNC